MLPWHLNTPKYRKKPFFSVRVHKDWNRLQRVVMESPFLVMVRKNWTWLWTICPSCPYFDHRA